MAENSKIEWTDNTFSAWRGCLKISEACRWCYASAFSHRNPKSLGVFGTEAQGGTRVVAADNYWKQPIKWNAEGSSKVFCASLSDIFEDWQGKMLDHKGRELVKHRRCGWSAATTSLPSGDQVCGKCGGSVNPVTMDDVRNRLFQLVDDTPNLSWQLLTKRPENVRQMWTTVTPDEEPQEVIKPIPDYKGYFVSNRGIVYTTAGTSECLHCGLPLSGNVRRKFCGKSCNSAHHYEVGQGRKDHRSEGDRKPMSPDRGEDGHQRVTLRSNGKAKRLLVHRIVLSVFDRAPVDGEQGRHLDGNPENNRIGNLRWGSQSDNWDDSKRHGTHQRWSKLSVEGVNGIRIARSEGQSYANIGRRFGVSDTQARNIVLGLQWADQHVNGASYRSNCWIGCTTENQEMADKRIPELLKCSDLTPIRFLSIEPLLGPIDLSWHIPIETDRDDKWRYRSKFGESTLISWAIVGCESGPHRRETKLEWVRDLRDQCKAAGVAFFCKQLEIDGKVTTDLEQFPEDLRIREFPTA